MNSIRIALALAALTAGGLAQAAPGAAAAPQATTTTHSNASTGSMQSDERERNSSRAPIVEPETQQPGAAPAKKGAKASRHTTAEERDMNSSRAPLVDPKHKVVEPSSPPPSSSPSYPVDGPNGATTSRQPIVGK
jgi:hypothetical protein